MSELREVLAQVLAAEGALVEPLGPDGLEVVAPAHVQEALSLPEWSRLGFGPEFPDQALQVSFESDWVTRLERLLQNRGRRPCISLGKDPGWDPPRHLERLAEQQIVLENATYRLAEVKRAETRYLVLIFRITAVSDEKREDLLSLCINESNGALADGLFDPLLSDVRALKDSRAIGPEEAAGRDAWSARRLHELASRALPPRIRARLAPFLAGMERRMARDLERLHTYHSGLRVEVLSRFCEKARKGAAAESEVSERMRLEAIEREYEAKVADLERKYAMTVEVTLTQSWRIAMPVWRLALLILRRKGRRAYALDWNPVSRSLDALPCEGCWARPKTYFVCDAELHFLCGACLWRCPSCGKNVCRACHGPLCPKCQPPPAVSC